MNITLNDSEIKAALVKYVGDQGIDISDKNVEVVLVAGRGERGHSAQIDINARPIPLEKVAEDPGPQEEQTKEVDDNTSLFGNG